jgi:hypothetical protein
LGIGSCLIVSCLALAAAQGASRRITWADTGPLRPRLEARGIAAAGFAAYVERVSETNLRRVREGDLDHLVFYLLQSTRISSLPPIEPALSAKALVESLDGAERETFLKGAIAPPSRIPGDVAARTAALVRALDGSARDPRLAYFRELVASTVPRRDRREDALRREYLRVMRFVYEKEFVAQRAPRTAEAVAELYRTRGLSTDTAVEAGYLVHQGLGVVKALRPGRMIRRVLIVGPGLDLAPRTAFAEERAPESYQPWAVIDALLALSLADVADLEVVAADINPRVVRHLERAREAPPVLTIESEIRNTPTVKLTDEYHRYVAGLGRAVEAPDKPHKGVTSHGPRTVYVGAAPARALRAVTLDVVTGRLDGPAFDLVVATNLLPYFDDVAVMLAMSNIASMVAPDGVFLHNEARPLVGDVAVELDMPLEQARTAVIATVRGGPPLYDSVFVHTKRAGRQP